MRINLKPVNDDNREAVLALDIREDQPFVAPNWYSLKEADETNAKRPGYARPFGIYADDTLVGFTSIIRPASGRPAPSTMTRPF